MKAEAIEAARYKGDIDLLAAVRADPVLDRRLEDAETIARRNSLRARLLSSAVRVDVALLPQLAESFERLDGQFGLEEGLEAYVHNQPAVNAFISRGHEHTIVVLSSGAVNLLSAEELEFVIGHELGHSLYGHLEVGIGHLLREEGFPPEVNMRLRAWQRAAEISADRAGLLSCGSLEVAANALFKTLSGLRLPGGGVDPREFAGQWEQLVDEVLTEGERGPWQVSHPLPPLRMKAMLLFWEGRADPAATDAEVARLLALMDPLAGDGKGELDPLLARFFFWGGLYIALADGSLDREEVHRLQSVAPPGIDVGGLVRGPAPDVDGCLEQFRVAKEERRAKLTAVELHRIFQGLIDVAAADGRIGSAEVDRLCDLGKILGIGRAACDLLVAEYRKENQGESNGGQ